MPYVSRDESGNINGVYANKQDFAEEYLPDDDPEVTAFLEASNPDKPSVPQDPVQDVVLLDHENRLRSLEGQPPLTPDQFRKARDDLASKG